MYSKLIIVVLALTAVAMVCTAGPVGPPADGIYKGIRIFHYKHFNLHNETDCTKKCHEWSDCKAYSYCDGGYCDLGPFDLTSDEITDQLLEFQKLDGRDHHKVEILYPNGADHKDDIQPIVRDDECKLWTKV